MHLESERPLTLLRRTIRLENLTALQIILWSNRQKKKGGALRLPAQEQITELTVIKWVLRSKNVYLEAGKTCLKTKHESKFYKCPNLLEWMSPNARACSDRFPGFCMWKSEALKMLKYSHKCGREIHLIQHGVDAAASVWFGHNSWPF